MGKSTTMHFLCGSTMKMSKQKTNDGALDHITYDKLNPNLDETEKKMLTGVEMSAKAVSCTQFIKGVKINHEG